MCWYLIVAYIFVFLMGLEFVGCSGLAALLGTIWRLKSVIGERRGCWNKLTLRAVPRTAVQILRAEQCKDLFGVTSLKMSE